MGHWAIAWSFWSYSLKQLFCLPAACVLPFWYTYSFLWPAHVLSHAPVHLSRYDAWQALPCGAEADYWLVVGWDQSLLGILGNQDCPVFSYPFWVSHLLAADSFVLPCVHHGVHSASLASRCEWWLLEPVQGGRCDCYKHCLYGLQPSSIYSFTIALSHSLVALFFYLSRGKATVLIKNGFDYTHTASRVKKLVWWDYIRL